MELLTDSSVIQKDADREEEQTSERELFEEGGSKAHIAVLKYQCITSHYLYFYIGLLDPNIVILHKLAFNRLNKIVLYKDCRACFEHLHVVFRIQQFQTYLLS